MNIKIYKRIMSMCLVLTLIVCVIIPVNTVEAANEGDRTYKYITYTYDQIYELCDTLQDTKKQIMSGEALGEEMAEAIANVKNASPYTKPAVEAIIFVFTGMFTYDINKEYEFYSGIRSEMIKRDADKVKIRYTKEYSVYKMYWEKFYDWKVVEKKAVLYK